jgi:D-alanyl-D-alanine carboxypeptidase-like protein/putative Flp pilus-assembly TadE/G-like protein
VAADGQLMTKSNGEAGQASLLLLGVVAALLAGLLVLFAFGQALGAKGRHQRAADLAAVSAAQVMRDNYGRLFEPPLLPNGLPNPRHLSNAAYLALARTAARRGAVRNGLRARAVAVHFPGVGFAPTRVTVRVRGEAPVRAAGDDRPRAVAVAARATAELAPDISALGMPANASGGGYSGPLAYRQGKPMRPDVALAFDRLAAAARREAGLNLIVVSGFRSDAEQARLFAANPDPKWVAPPGQSLHRYGTELDLGPASAYGWLEANAERFGFIKRYSWVLRPIPEGTRSGLTGGGSVAHRTVGLASGRLLVGIASS